MLKLFQYFVLVLSRFLFTSPSSNNCEIVREQKCVGGETTIRPDVDEDGDLLVQRLQDDELEKNVITIGNDFSTSKYRSLEWEAKIRRIAG